MSEQRNDGGSAFPVPPTIFTPAGGMSFASQGMTLRDYFAAKAMQEILSWDNSWEDCKVAAAAYMMADAMLKARQA